MEHSMASSVVILTCLHAFLRQIWQPRVHLGSQLTMPPLLARHHQAMSSPATH